MSDVVKVKFNFGKEPGKIFYVGDKTEKPIVKESGVNVLYLTNKCNLACTYCYEDLPGRPAQIMTKKQIQNSIDQILSREDPEKQTLIVLFGGEATLEWENVCFAMSYAYSKKTNIHFNMSTNGIKYLSQKFINETKENFFYKKGLLSIDVSFDGVGNQDRVFHDGSSSTFSMIKVLTNLVKNNFRFRLRYTIQKGNIDHWYEDITKLSKLFKPERIITSVAWSTLENYDKSQDLLESGKQKFRNDWINKKISIPVCELFCDMCNGCGERKDVKTYFTNEGNVTTYKNYENTPLFHDFKEKEIQ
jgi:sulfatase maturation enzyme AslB (radical SAM superfamily)